MSDFKSKMIDAAKQRFLPHLLAIAVLWPILSCVFATHSALNVPYHPLTLKEAILLSLGGALVLWPDFLAIGSLALLTSLIFFSFLASLDLLPQRRKRSLVLEPIVLFASVVVAASFCYPALLSHSIFFVLRALPVWALGLTLLLLLGAAIAFLASAGKRLLVVVIFLLLASSLPLATLARNRMAPPIPAKPPVVLLGIDSVSLVDDLSHFEGWTRSNGGTWYTKAVSPGLLTNAVWSSILLMQPVNKHGVFHTFQSRPDLPIPTLIEVAKNRGFHTVSVFPDQLTCWAGSDYAFDYDKSGPIGWKQLASSIFENASILLPLVKPLLPKLPFSVSPPNHAGAYTYSIDREFNEIFSQSSGTRDTLVVGHSTYLHVPAYPTSFDLTREELTRVLKSPAGRINDRSFDWQAVDQPEDAIPVRRWKLNRVQTALTGAAERMQFLSRGGRMILLSDHGDRAGITFSNFWQKKYHNVMFATFNLPAREAHRPISSIDSGSILRIVDLKPFPPEVEFTVSAPGEWEPLIRSAKLGWDGRVSLDAQLLSTIFSRLAFARPYLDNLDGEIVSPLP